MGRPPRDLTKENPFGRLMAVSCTGRKYGAGMYFLCLCDCGAVIEARGSHLTDGNVQSCGCLKRETSAECGRKTGGNNRTHGEAGTPTYLTWAGMIRRCFDPRCLGYDGYGGRGITVCNAWKDYNAFVSDMGTRPQGTTIDRIDNDGDYEPGNCRWATNREQQTNRSNNVRLTHNGNTMTLVEWAESLGMNPGTLWSRINTSGWPVERALTETVHPRKAGQ